MNGIIKGMPVQLLSFKFGSILHMFTFKDHKGADGRGEELQVNKLQIRVLYCRSKCEHFERMAENLTPKTVCIMLHKPKRKIVHLTCFSSVSARNRVSSTVTIAQFLSHNHSPCFITSKLQFKEFSSDYVHYECHSALKLADVEQTGCNTSISSFFGLTCDKFLIWPVYNQSVFSVKSRY